MLTKPKKDNFIDLRNKPDDMKMGCCDAPKMSAPMPTKGPVFTVRDVKLPLTIDDVMTIKDAKVKLRLRNLESGMGYEGKMRDVYEIEVVEIAL